jgi:hypothetical protein
MIGPTDDIFYTLFFFFSPRLLDGSQGAPNMHRLITTLKNQNVKANHIVLGSEACHCPSTGYAGGDLSVAWTRAERYGHTILSDLAAGSNGKNNVSNHFNSFMKTEF